MGYKHISNNRTSDSTESIFCYRSPTLWAPWSRPSPGRVWPRCGTWLDRPRTACPDRPVWVGTQICKSSFPKLKFLFSDFNYFGIKRNVFFLQSAWGLRLFAVCSVLRFDSTNRPSLKIVMKIYFYNLLK
jgi:hypothetical protein